MPTCRPSRNTANLLPLTGGASTTGRERILDIQPEDLHQRVPVILGSRIEVDQVFAYHFRKAG